MRFLKSLYLFLFCLVGIALIAAGLEGYLIGAGSVEWWARPLPIVSGFLIAFPYWVTLAIGGTLALLTFTAVWARKKLALRRVTSGVLRDRL